MCVCAPRTCGLKVEWPYGVRFTRAAGNPPLIDEYIILYYKPFFGCPYARVMFVFMRDFIMLSRRVYNAVIRVFFAKRSCIAGRTRRRENVPYMRIFISRLNVF